MDTRFHRDSDGNGPGIRIRGVYDNTTIYHPYPSHPYHISGKYGPLGWI